MTNPLAVPALSLSAVHGEAKGLNLRPLDPRRKRESQMAIYLVDRDLPGITMEQLAATQRIATETSERFTANGKPVRYIRSTFVPEESHCMCLFEAADAKIVQEVNEAAQIPFTRIIEAVDLTP